MNKYIKGDIINLSLSYNPMQTDSRNIEMLMMELPVNGNRNKRLKDFIEKITGRKDSLSFDGGINRTFTIQAIIKTECEV